jgi:hypothetical protein
VEGWASRLAKRPGWSMTPDSASGEMSPIGPGVKPQGRLKHSTVERFRWSLLSGNRRHSYSLAGSKLSWGSVRFEADGVGHAGFACTVRKEMQV